MTISAFSGGKVTIRAVIKRADGSVEDWGVVHHSDPAAARAYALKHPDVIANRIKWRMKQWFRKSKTQG
jgi:hypothetical protein